jgi:hypothetical protein
MKLNNRGWGLGFLIIAGVIVILILIVTSIKINNLIKDNRKSNDSNKNSQQTDTSDNVETSALYKTLETNLEDAGEAYLIYHETLLDNTDDFIIVKYDTLKSEGHITNLPDPVGNKNCDGYVMIKTDFSVKPFIKCSNYKTLNYDLWEE